MLGTVNIFFNLCYRVMWLKKHTQKKLCTYVVGLSITQATVHGGRESQCSNVNSELVCLDSSSGTISYKLWPKATYSYSFLNPPICTMKTISY